MIRLSSVIEQFETNFLAQYGSTLLPSQRKALSAIKQCRSSHSPLMKVSCSDCDHLSYVPHSCGHRSCPHCQSHESQQWIERQCQKQLPVNYFMITFTLPKELRPLFWSSQRLLYQQLFQCAWETLKSFSHNDKQLKGMPGMVAVLHTHSRRLDFHPHLHTIMPAGAMDKVRGLWRKKEGAYLFNHKALAKVFRAKMLAAIKQARLTMPANYPEKWVVDCKQVGSGEKAFVYLGRYLYKGVIQEKDIINCANGNVTFRYKESKTQRYKTRTLPGADFIQLILQHVLPRRFRRARDYGLLHPNSKTLIRRLHYLLKFNINQWVKKGKPRPVITCSCCGGVMNITQTRLERIGHSTQAHNP
ncbi:MAG: IS91 family transposase [Gammaproteobacteria bacterium]|nr:MAG: IS91 family transposase [Gammaproteobacteria bacterium]